MHIAVAPDRTSSVLAEKNTASLWLQDGHRTSRVRGSVGSALTSCTTHVQYPLVPRTTEVYQASCALNDLQMYRRYKALGRIPTKCGSQCRVAHPQDDGALLAGVVHLVAVDAPARGVNVLLVPTAAAHYQLLMLPVLLQCVHNHPRVGTASLAQCQSDLSCGC